MRSSRIGRSAVVIGVCLLAISAFATGGSARVLDPDPLAVPLVITPTRHGTPVATIPPANPISPANGRSLSSVPQEAKSRRDRVKLNNGLTEQALNALALDPSAFVDQGDRVFFVDPPIDPLSNPGEKEQVATNVDAYPTEAYPTQQEAFSLHSRLGSSKTLFLDFDGATVSGTAWNSAIPSKTVPAYDADGNPSSFSGPELDLITKAWQAAQEDFAPFDVDVTTQEPSYSQLNRSSATDAVYGTSVIITGDNWICPSACSGISYVNALTTDYYKPSWVFTSSFFTLNPQIIAGIISHESGHAFGLYHDGTPTLGYYAGQGIWQPIMGSGSYSIRPVSQWSKGEYGSANNGENDIAIIASTSPLVPDDVSTRIDVPVGTPTATLQGLIGTSTDTDTYRVQVGSGGRLNVTLRPDQISPNLDATLTVTNASGTTIGYVDTPGIPALQTLNLVLSAGTYDINVAGTGYLSPLTTGYSSYGSIGRYTLGISLYSSPGAPAAVIGTLGDRSLTADWQIPADTGGGIDRYTTQICLLETGGLVTCTDERTTSNLTATYSDLQPGRSYYIQITATNPAGTSPRAVSPTMTVVRTPDPPVLDTPVVAPSSLVVSWTSPVSTGAPATGFEVVVTNMGSGASSTQTVPPTTFSTNFTSLISGDLYRVSARTLSSIGPSAGTSFRLVAFGRAPAPSAPGAPPVPRSEAPSTPALSPGTRLPASAS